MRADAGNYDLIAAIYDLDMGASMRLDDVGHYLGLANAAGGHVLELGCGTGRILSALAAQDMEVCGIDRSLPMLHRARTRCGPGVPLVQADMRELPLRGDFALAILGYSLPTYLLDEDDWRGCADGLRRALRPGAWVVLDAFVPQPGLPGGGWMRDYARRTDAGWLVRHKRIFRLSEGCHGIERRYRLKGFFGGTTLRTFERIRPLAPERLIALGERHIGPLRQVDFDYAPGAACSGARFCSAVFRMA